jgi:predicted SAM-dependent methyltransferase
MKLTLNVGCGTRTYKEYPTGYKCINFDQRGDLPEVDEVGNVKDLSRFEAGKFDYILASDIIEHFPIAETQEVLKEWRRVLNPLGVIEFRLPNLAAICKQYEKAHNAKNVSWLLYGGQDYPGNFHYVGFDREFFTTQCTQAGFVVVDYKEEGFNMIVKCRRNDAT